MNKRKEKIIILAALILFFLLIKLIEIYNLLEKKDSEIMKNLQE